MWQKPVIIILLFYFFVLLQNSFFTHFNLFGAIPNLVFILFFLLVFFEGRSKGFLAHSETNYQVFFIAAIAGIFLDIFSYTYIGPSIVILIMVGFLLKKIQSLLKNKEDKNPFVYFLPLFLVSLLLYGILSGLYFHFLDPNKIITSFGIGTILTIIYNLLIVSVLFYIYKWQKFIR